MTQQELFASPIEVALATPVARRSDPESSHLAAREVTDSGRMEGQCLGVLALLKKHPLSTSLELGQHGYDRFVCARRLPQLERAGLVARRSPRICTVGNRKAVTWEAL
jgi:hypothetical protein